MSERSKLGALIKAQPRKTYEFDVDKFRSLGNEVNKVAIRVPTKREQDIALAGAHAYVAKRAEAAPSVANDPEILQDAKSAFIVAACCLDPQDGFMPVWPTGEVVSEDLTADQIGVLVRLVNEVRAKDGPTPETLSDAEVEAFAATASIMAGTDAPEAVLTPLPHPYLVQLYILTAMKLREARQELEALKPAEPSEEENRQDHGVVS